MTYEVTSHCFMNYIFIVGGLIVGTNVVTCVEIKIEAETMSGNVGAISERSSASGKRSVHLHSGESLYQDICLLSPTEVFGLEVVYSNDGDSDRVQIALGNVVLGVTNTERYTNQGQGWSRFISSKAFTPITTVGRQSLKLTIIQSDVYGVEIDFIKFNINSSQSLESLKCQVFCFQDIEYTHDGGHTLQNGRAEQKSVPTSCAEEDNINVPIFHDNPQKFVVTAHMPKYSSFLNSRGPDWENCDFYDAVWKFSNLHLASSQILTSGNDKAQLTMSLSPDQLLVSATRIVVMEIDFVLGNVTLGSTESVLGTVTSLTGLKLSGPVSFQFQYYDRYDHWSVRQIKYLDHGDTFVEFNTSDHTFREGGGNKVRIELFTDHASVSDVIIGEMTMRMRQLAPDNATQLYKDQQTVVEGVEMDAWWRVNETMTVTVNNVDFGGLHYVRIYQREPWSDLRVSQVFVLYQDGNVRLLPLTPHGLDWIPFGSSVIIGQTDPESPRPSAAINHVDIDPFKLKVTVWYNDGSVVPFEIKTTGPETQLIVTDSHFVGNLQKHPFFTFRSMYVAYGNCDVDHVSVNGKHAIPILDHWSTLDGTYFAFFRMCISKHNTQSPDITIAILP